MRAVKSVLVMAGALKRANPQLREDIVLIRALRDSSITALSYILILYELFEIFRNSWLTIFHCSWVLCQIFSLGYRSLSTTMGY